MPSGGVTSGAAAGLRLQPTTPGIMDVGNANISGKMLARSIGNGTAQFNGADTTLALGKYITLPANYTGNATTNGEGFGSSNIFIGNSMDLSAIGSNQTQSSTIIGSQNGGQIGAGTANVIIGQNCYFGGGQGSCVYIGNASGDAGNTNVAGSVAIGVSAQTSGNYQVSIGNGARCTATGFAYGIAVGYGATAYAAGGIVVGQSSNDGGFTNCIVLGAGFAATQANSILIGSNSHTGIVRIGPYTIGQSLGGTRLIADLSPTATAADGTLLYSSITAPRTVALPLANAVPLGYRLIVVDGSGAVTAVNTITLNRAGADTINGLTSASIVVAYGLKEIVSDGVSKWTIIRTI